MKIFAELITLPSSRRMLIEILTQDVTILFTPGSVVNLGHYGLHLRIGFIVAVIETNRIEAIAEVAQVSEQANGADRPLSQSFLYKVPHSLLEWYSRITQVIPPAEIGEINPIVRPKNILMEQSRQFLQVEEHKENTIAKGVPHRQEATVANVPLVDAALRVHRDFPKCSHTARALFTPSSWKP
jgi:hypothetical protein